MLYGGTPLGGSPTIPMIQPAKKTSKKILNQGAEGDLLCFGPWGDDRHTNHRMDNQWTLLNRWISYASDQPEYAA